MNYTLHTSVEQFLYRKAELCDNRAWNEYLELFDEESEFHLPQWDSEHEYTKDPKIGLSLFYYKSRAGLEDRIYRLETGRSSASAPMPRTQHQISNVRVTELPAGEVEAKVVWNTFLYRFGATSHFFGHATYLLKPTGESWKIVRKHVVLLNDTINEVFDFYHV